MRKFLSYFLVVFIFVFAGMIGVKAATLSVSPSTVDASTASADKTFVLSITASSTTEFDTLIFDKAYIGYQGNASGASVSGSNIILKETNATVTFLVKKGLNLNENKAVTITAKDSNSGATVATTTVTIRKNAQTPPTTTTKPPVTTTTTKAYNKSNNANLKSLDIKGDDNSDVVLSPNFSSTVYNYSATVSGSVKTITINAIMEDGKSNMVISNNAQEELIAGENNKITITVTAEDGTKKAYVVNIKREALAADATLQYLTIMELPDFTLEPDVYSYKIKLDSDITELNLDYVPTDVNATVTIEGNENLEDGSKIKILVTAQDGSKKEYTLTVSKKKSTEKVQEKKASDEKNPLIIMGLSIAAFGLIGSIIYVAKR